MPKKTQEPQPETYVMRPEHVEQVSRVMFLKSYLQSQMNTLDSELATLFRIAYGVDISQGDWHADLEKGVLSRASNVQP